MVLLRDQRKSFGVTKVLLRVQRKSYGFALVLLMVKRKLWLYNGFASSPKKKAMVLQWFCLWSKENLGFTLVLFDVKRKSHGFALDLLRV